MDRRAWWTKVHRVTKSRTRLTSLSMHTHRNSTSQIPVSQLRLSVLEGNFILRHPFPGLTMLGGKLQGLIHSLLHCFR